MFTHVTIVVIGICTCIAITSLNAEHIAQRTQDASIDKIVSELLDQIAPLLTADADASLVVQATLLTLPDEPQRVGLRALVHGMALQVWLVCGHWISAQQVLPRKPSALEALLLAVDAAGWRTSPPEGFNVNFNGPKFIRCMCKYD